MTVLQLLGHAPWPYFARYGVCFPWKAIACTSARRVGPDFASPLSELARAKVVFFTSHDMYAHSSTSENGTGMHLVHISCDKSPPTLTLVLSRGQRLSRVGDRVFVCKIKVQVVL